MLRVVFVLILLAACVSTGRSAGGDAIDRDYSVGGFRWKEGSIVYVYATTKNVDGELAICAAWAPESERAMDAMLNGQVIAAAKFYVEGEAVLQGGAFMPEIGWNEGRVIGQPTACRVTGVAWQASHDGADVKIEFPRMRFVI